LGLRWGPWRLGTVDQADYAAAYTSQRPPSLGYQLREGREANAVVSLRLHNISTGEGVEALSGGTYTIRARLSGNVRLDEDWSAIGESTVDVLGRGDGITLSAGLARRVLRNPTWALGASGSLSFGSAAHWTNARKVNNVPRYILGAGLGGADFGLGARGHLSKEWGWTLGYGLSVPMGQIRREVTRRPVHSVSFGLQRYGL
jgi:hypothetical protein